MERRVPASRLRVLSRRMIVETSRCPQVPKGAGGSPKNSGSSSEPLSWHRAAGAQPCSMCSRGWPACAAICVLSLAGNSVPHCSHLTMSVLGAAMRARSPDNR
jgi:hypothetical protein